MRRALAILSLLLLTCSLPCTASADWFGAYLQGHGGFQQTNRTGHTMIGASGGLVLLGFEAFADLRFLRDAFSEDRGMWNQAGLRFGLEMPVPAVDIELYAGLSYIYSEVAAEDQDPDDFENERDGYRGLNPHLGARLDVPLFPFVYLGVQAEAGYHILFPNDLTYSNGNNFAAMGLLKFKL